MNRGKLIAGIILIFVLGGLAGALTVRLYHQRESRHGPPRHPPLEKRIDFIMERLADDLDLTKEQAAEIRPIVEKGEKAIAELMDRMDPEMTRIHDQNFTAIREKLNPDQQKKLDNLVARLKKFHRKPSE